MSRFYVVDGGMLDDESVINKFVSLFINMAYLNAYQRRRNMAFNNNTYTKCTCRAALSQRDNLKVKYTNSEGFVQCFSQTLSVITVIL